MRTAKSPLLLFIALLCAVTVFGRSSAHAEDGYDLWLRYPPIEADAAGAYRAVATSLMPAGDTPTIRAATAELARGLAGLTGRPVPVVERASSGTIMYGVSASPLIAELNLPMEELGEGGYVIRSLRLNGRRVTVIAGNSDIGVLYGAFDLLRRIQTRQPVTDLDVRNAPKVKLRLLNHWDNLDRTVERGYAGQSIWD